MDLSTSTQLRILRRGTVDRAGLEALAALVGQPAEDVADFGEPEARKGLREILSMIRSAFGGEPIPEGPDAKKWRLRPEMIKFLTGRLAQQGESVVLDALGQMIDARYWGSWCRIKAVIEGVDPFPKGPVTEALTSPRWHVRRAAAYLLSECCRGDADVLPALLACLEHPRAEVREAVIGALVAYPSLPVSALPTLLVEAQSAGHRVYRRDAARAAALVGAAGLGRVMEQLQEPDIERRNAAWQVVTWYESDLDRITPVVAAQITSPSASLRRKAAGWLGWKGRGVWPVSLAALLVGTRDRVCDVRRVALRSLSEVVDSERPLTREALDAVTERLDDPVARVRRVAVRVFTNCPELPTDVGVAVAARIHDTHDSVRAVVWQWCRAWAGRSASARAVVEGFRRHPRAKMQRQAWETLRVLIRGKNTANGERPV